MSCYSAASISPAHRGFSAFFERGDARRIPAALVPRIRRILSDLDSAIQPGDMDLPGYRLHPLAGDRRGQWSVRVSGNWRIVFRFRDGEAVDVTLIDYH
ncbi:MAG: type II toxin-antitoxin system RelE/ParE family toxin [Rhodospirillaceae bacterium]|nr:type II toxin-antitoxin system RelE/ParE family toxin [Rhodospirillaceae bacterium]